MDIETKTYLEAFATKKDLEAFATKQDLEAFATKKDLEAFATKKDLEAFATKKDLEAFVTKTVFENHTQMVENRFQAIDRRFDLMDRKIDDKFEESKRYMGTLFEEMVRRFELLTEIVSPHGDRILDHERRLDSLEMNMAIVQDVIRKR